MPIFNVSIPDRPLTNIACICTRTRDSTLQRCFYERYITTVSVEHILINLAVTGYVIIGTEVIEFTLTRMVIFGGDQSGRKYIHQHSLNRHVTRNHTDHPVFDCGQCERSFARSGNLEKHKRICSGGTVVVPVSAPTAKKRRIAPEFKLRKTCKSLGGAVEQFTVNMKETRHLSALKKAMFSCM